MKIIEEEENDNDELLEEEERPLLLLCGFTFSELLLFCNGIIALCLCYLSIFTRLPQYDGKTFIDYVNRKHEQTKTTNERVLYFFLEFFNECTSTKGGYIIFESIFVLFSLVCFTILLELNRNKNVSTYGFIGYLLSAFFPILCQLLGVSIIFPFVLVWISKRQRNKMMLKENKSNNLVSLPKTFISCSVSLSMLFLLTYVLGKSEEDNFNKGETFFDQLHLTWFLIFPMLPPLLFLFFFPSSSNQKELDRNQHKWTQKLAGILSIATFLIIGAIGAGAHVDGFNRFAQKELAARENTKNIVELIVKDALSTAPSRFLFVELIHVCFSLIIFSLKEMKGSGGVGLIFFVFSLLGPAGTFGMLAAHHEYRLLKEDKVF